MSANEKELVASILEATELIRAQAIEIARLRAALDRIALGMIIKLDAEDGPDVVWMDAEELSAIALAARENKP